MEEISNTKPKTKPIGIIDSGVGGISVLNEICKLCGGQEFHYIADSAWCPYGNKSAELITERVFKLTDFLISQGCETIVIACNSATIASISALRASYLIPFVGMEPAVKPAAEQTKSGVIGVLATEASLAGEKFHQLVNAHGTGVKVITSACPKFVTLVEAGILQGEEVNTTISEYASPMLTEGADTLVLGCTHYPFLRKSIETFAGENVQVIDTGEAVAKQALKRANISENSAQLSNWVHIYTSGDLELLAKIFPKLSPNLDAKLKELKIS